MSVLVETTGAGADVRDFEGLLERTHDNLMNKATKEPDYFWGRDASGVEVDVLTAMKAEAVGTQFDRHIHYYSQIKKGGFPDIVAKKYFGVEVKTTRQKSWGVVGNSVMESTRCETVERIYVMFGRLRKPSEFRYGLYEDCIVDVGITHQPRYYVKMDLGEEDQTLFEKMGRSYRELVGMDNKDVVKVIHEYLNRNLSPGELIVGLDDGENTTKLSRPVIKTELSTDEKERMKVEVFALFPEVLGTSSLKFSRPVAWELEENNIVLPNFRDSFTSGGCKKVDGQDVPGIVKRLDEKVTQIVEFLERCDSETLKKCWQRDVPPEDRVETWITTSVEQGQQYLKKKGIEFDIEAMIRRRMRERLD